MERFDGEAFRDDGTISHNDNEDAPLPTSMDEAHRMMEIANGAAPDLQVPVDETG